ncbi:hypothetical protein [Terrihabitans rhizophilus]|uniref:DUF4189 domain-containing protein n=1 Tax=Terrihabitans rhizophilus TaxID=3092662 RepID=A0ABU4RWA5_9HYPH|nr:hypothetical protein [Terrihabitans sp. PJ23]MDX6807166.1 hypothetical protein [Terrihabitans sp. PJ23]
MGPKVKTALVAAVSVLAYFATKTAWTTWDEHRQNAPGGTFHKAFVTSASGACMKTQMADPAAAGLDAAAVGILGEYCTCYAHEIFQLAGASAVRKWSGMAPEATVQQAKDQGWVQKAGEVCEARIVASNTTPAAP